MDLDVDGDLALWAALGIDCVGLSFAKVEALPVGDVAGRVREAGLRISSVGVGPPYALDRPDTWAATTERVDRAAMLAARVGAGCVYLATGRAPRMRWEEAAARFAEAAAGAAAVAATHGVRLAFEPSTAERADLGFARTVQDTETVAAGVGASIVVELTACWAEPGLDAWFAALADRIALVQVGDRTLRRADPSLRLPPGEGELPLDDLLASVLAGGYRGPVELELVGGGPGIDAHRARLEPALRWIERGLADTRSATSAPGRSRTWSRR